jgi:hypothetical protein
VSTTNNPQPYKLTKGTLSRVMLAHSFAEYDPILQKEGVFVETPAARAAADISLGKCIFVGRRGSGKTAINLHLHNRNQKTVCQLYPKCLTSDRQRINSDKYSDTRRCPFHLLVPTFKHALALEAVGQCLTIGAISKNDLLDTVSRDKNRIDQMDFDSPILDVLEELQPTLGPGQDKQFL